MKALIAFVLFFILGWIVSLWAHDLLGVSITYWQALGWQSIVFISGYFFGSGFWGAYTWRK